jgi:hypothetical protein
LSAHVTKREHNEGGSALVEAAIIFPCLVLVLYWSAALTDVLVLKLKAAEALRYALWETTVFKSPAQINSEVAQKFVDLRSPRQINNQFTGLLMYPLARDMLWAANVDTTSQRVPLGGNRADVATGGIPIIDRFINLLLGTLSRAVDGAMRAQRFNVNGKAMARVTLVHARHDEQFSPILKGGDLLGLKGGNDLDHPPSMTNLTFQAPLPRQRPMFLVFDTWKAWPKPPAYTRDGADTNVNTPPSQTYPEVEKQVSAQVDKIAFFGLSRIPGVSTIRNILNRLMGAGVTQTVLGGRPPDVFSADRMDDRRRRGPITMLPPERSRENWVPQRCEINGSMVPCPNQRVGDVTSAGSSARTLDSDHSVGNGIDRTRYTLPYRINTQYWTRYGGLNRDLSGRQMASVTARIAQDNEYVRTYNCRGHYFAASNRPQETDVNKRYQQRCR